jgi:hypothetical protein
MLEPLGWAPFGDLDAEANVTADQLLDGDPPSRKQVGSGATGRSVSHLWKAGAQQWASLDSAERVLRHLAGIMTTCGNPRLWQVRTSLCEADE